MKITVAFLILLLVTPSLAQPRRPAAVSIVQLIASPSKYHRKLVRVIGFVSVRFKGTAVYLHRDDYEHAIYKNGLWLDLNGGNPRREHDEFHEKYVLIEGVFDANMTGHRGRIAVLLRASSECRRGRSVVRRAPANNGMHPTANSVTLIRKTWRWRRCVRGG